MQELIKARGCYETGDLRQAEECYRRVLEADPHHGEALHRLGLMAMQEGKPAVAADYLQRAATASPADAVVQNHLGVALAGSAPLGGRRGVFRAGREVQSPRRRRTV